MENNTNSTNHVDNEVRQIEFKAGDVVLPMGFMVRDQLGTRFHPNVVALLAVAVPLTVVASMFMRTAGRSLPRILRALKRR